jgi:N-acetylmuramoyl-L-alanine amidase
MSERGTKHVRGQQRRRIFVAALTLAVCGGLFVGQTLAEPAKTTALKCERGAFRLILDVGHTKESQGAISARGVPEYEFNLDLAKEIEAQLMSAGFVKTTLLITTGPGRESLVRRVQSANAMSADLLLSIHHDSVPDSFKESWELDDQKNWYSDRFRGHSIFVSYDNGDRNRSLGFARLLGKQLKARGLQYTPHYTKSFMGRWRRELVDAETGVYRYDQLIVLRATRMPAVLLEGGSIVNREEELVMGSPERRAQIAGAVVDAADGFCGAHHRLREVRTRQPAGGQAASAASAR